MGCPGGITTFEGLIRQHIAMMRKYARDLKFGPKVVTTGKIVERITSCADEVEGRFEAIKKSQSQPNLEF